MGAGNSANKDQKKAAEAAFKAFDADKNKKMSLPEFEAMLKKEGCNVPQEQYALAFHLVDSNGSGSIDQKEFGRLYKGMQSHNFAANFFDLICFAADKDGDGQFDKKELKVVYHYFKKELTGVEEAKYKKAKMTKDEFVAVVKGFM